MHWYSKVTIILRKRKNGKETIIVRRRKYVREIKCKLKYTPIMTTIN